MAILIKNLNLLVAAVLVNIAFVVPSHAAVTLQVNNDGLLTGATGVTVLGELYDVTFTDGTCKAIFNGCDSPDDFVFGTTTTARAASWALLDQVFVGVYDDYPALTLGTPQSAMSQIITPVSGQGPGWFISIAAWNDWLYLNADGVNEQSSSVHYDSTGSEWVTFAVWTPTSPVPEPSNSAMLVAALALIWSKRRRLRSHAQ